MVMQVEEIKFNYDLGIFGDTLKRIVLKKILLKVSYRY